ILSKTPIMASSPVHNLWWYTDVIPESYRKKGPPGIEEYFDHYNVSLTIAHERVWKNYFRQSSFRYTEIGTVGRFVLFKRTDFPDSYFHSGSGTIIEQTAQEVSLTSSTSENIVLRYNFFPFLEVEQCEHISPYKISDSIEFISLSNCA